MLWRLANAFIPEHPINVDRVFSGSYNTRSVLETLLAYTPQFYYCYPGRLEYTNGVPKIKEGHKHLIWLPETPHVEGVLEEKVVTGMVISELASEEIIYDALVMPPSVEGALPLDPEVQRRHLQMQINLIIIGNHFQYRTWIAQNDRGAIYKEKRLGEMNGVLASLDDHTLLSHMPEAIRAAHLIDTIWFRNTRFMPAVMEVEHSTGVVSGLNRMKGLQERIPSLQTRYVVIAADEDREMVLKRANEPQFHSLDVRFFSYSAVEELRWLCEHRNIQGVEDRFLDYYLEKAVAL